MKNNERYIDDLFGRLRQSEPVVSFSQTRALVEDFAPESQFTEIRWNVIMTSTIVLVIAGLTFLTLPHDPISHPTSAPAGAVSGAAAAEIRPTINDPGLTVDRQDGMTRPVAAVPNDRQEGPGEVRSLPILIDRIDGITTLDLDPLTLARLGIMPDTNGVRIFQKSGGTLMSILLHIGGTTLNPDAAQMLPPDVIPVDESVMKIRFVTSDEGLERVAIHDDGDPDYLAQENRIRALIDSAEQGFLDPETLEERMVQVYSEENARMAEERNSGRYVPILVRAVAVVGEEPTDGEFSWSPHIIVWFEPTPGFLAVLPEEVRQRVEDQLRWSTILRDKRVDETIDAFIDRRSQSGEELPSGISDDAVSGDLLGLAGSASGAITNAGISPNPARGSAQVHYGLAAPRNVTITLHDLQGKHLRTLHDTSPSTASLNVATIDLQGLIPGIYLVAISTAQERVVQRLVINR